MLDSACGPPLSPSCYPVESSPFSIDATSSEWLVSADEIRIMIATGALVDRDKRSFPVSGLGVKLRAGGLSDLQVTVVMDAITSDLNPARSQLPR